MTAPTFSTSSSAEPPTSGQHVVQVDLDGPDQRDGLIGLAVSYGEAISQLAPSEDFDGLIVWAIHDGNVLTTDGTDLRRVATAPDRDVILDSAPLLQSLRRARGNGDAARPRRRSFTDDYKLSVLEDYDRLTEPGAKGAFLRREELHTSHVVAWRRRRETGLPASPLD